MLYWGLAGKVLLEHLRGTPFLPWMLRLFGSKFGKGVFMDMTDITEFDCVSVGDYAALNQVARAADASLRGPGDEGRPRRDRPTASPSAPAPPCSTTPMSAISRGSARSPW